MEDRVWIWDWEGLNGNLFFRLVCSTVWGVGLYCSCPAARETLRKHFTKPFLQPDAPDCRYVVICTTFVSDKQCNGNITLLNTNMLLYLVLYLDL